MRLNEVLMPIRERLAKATAGPWYLAYQTPFGIGGAVCSPRNIHACNKHGEEIEVCKQPNMNTRNKDEMWANGRLISHAPQDLVCLIKALEIADAALAKIAQPHCAHPGDLKQARIEMAEQARIEIVKALKDKK